MQMLLFGNEFLTEPYRSGPYLSEWY